MQGEVVNEEDSYANFENNEAICKQYGGNLAEECRSQRLSENAPESLQAACGELQRLLILLK